ncbi:glutaredoxin family protein [bacterium]|nr:glutaredoxin family protein [bacterium]
MKWIFLSCLFSIIWIATADCQVHSWVDKAGVRHYSSSPPEDMKAVTDYKILNSLGDSGPSAREKGGQQPESVLIYTASWCSICKKAKAWMDSNNVPYREVDVEKSQENFAAYKRDGGKDGVPFIVVGQNKMEGFNENLLQGWLKQKK